MANSRFALPELIVRIGVGCGLGLLLDQWIVTDASVPTDVDTLFGCILVATLAVFSVPALVRVIVGIVQSGVDTHTYRD